MNITNMHYILYQTYKLALNDYCNEKVENVVNYIHTTFWIQKEHCAQLFQNYTAKPVLY